MSLARPRARSCIGVFAVHILSLGGQRGSCFSGWKTRAISVHVVQYQLGAFFFFLLKLENEGAQVMI